VDGVFRLGMSLATLALGIVFAAALIFWIWISQKY
jgi:hypothetical protein